MLTYSCWIRSPLPLQYAHLLRTFVFCLDVLFASLIEFVLMFICVGSDNVGVSIIDEGEFL